MGVAKRAWLYCDTEGCRENTSGGDAETVAQARGHARGWWATSLNGKRGDFCDECVEASRAARASEPTDGEGE